MEQAEPMRISCRKKADKTWIKWMKWGQHLGCHQKPERSFFIAGYQMPVCARCTGVFTGYVLSTVWYLTGKRKHKKETAVIGSLIMLTDWMLQALKIKPSTNGRRLVTGVFGGFGIVSFWALLLETCHLFFQKHLRS